MPTVHEFASTRQAYDGCQCNESIADGDVLSIPSQGVAGVAWTWPVAVTANAGDLHSLDGTGNPWEHEASERFEAFRKGWEAATALAREKGWALGYNPFDNPARVG